MDFCHSLIHLRYPVVIKKMHTFLYRRKHRNVQLVLIFPFAALICHDIKAGMEILQLVKFGKGIFDIRCMLHFVEIRWHVPLVKPNDINGFRFPE